MSDVKTRLSKPTGRIYLPELLKEVSKQESREDKVLMLRTYANRNEESLNLIKNFMQCTWHPAVDMDLPKPGAPEITTDYPDYNLAPGTLSKAFSKVKYFVKGHDNYIENTLKRESVFVQCLESMFKDDAKLFVMIKDKKIDKRVYPGIDEDLFREAFTKWLPEKNS